jgi:hypothetical protein
MNDLLSTREMSGFSVDRRGDRDEQRGGRVMTRATGSFEVTGGSEDPYDELDGGIKLTHASGSQAFTGDIAADGAVHWLMLYRADKTAHFVGLQRITGSVGGRQGSFAAAAEGDHDGKGSRITFQIIQGSGTGALEGIAGEGSLIAEGGPKGTYELEYTLDS